MKVVPAGLALTFLAGACAHTSASEGTAYTLDQLDQRPELLACSRYQPPWSGVASAVRVRVTFDLSVSGAAVNPQVVASRSIDGNMRELAREAAKSCQYTPGMRDGKAVAVTGLSRTFVFSLES